MAGQRSEEEGRPRRDEPGRTPGQAEGVDPDAEPQQTEEPGRTPGQAEGEREEEE